MGLPDIALPFGRNALFSNTSGTENIATGGSSLFFNTTGTFNTASGSNALRINQMVSS